jgi:hypothetical protein
MNKNKPNNEDSNKKTNDTTKEIAKIRIDFSLKREVFFVVVGAILGAVTFGISESIFQILLGLPYYIVRTTFGT